MTPAHINAALVKLEVSNDNHWTGDGLPRLETVRLLAGDQTLTREALTLASPGFTRASAYAASQGAPSPTPTPAPIAAPATPAAVADPETGDEEAATDSVVDELAAAQAVLANLREVKDNADAAYRAQVAAVDILIAAREKTDAAQQSTPHAIQQYLAAQRGKLQARGEQLVKVRAFEKEVGAKLADIVPKRSPLDVAMARKNTRGAARPGRT